ncbi:MAG: hypothetical protein J5829_02045 [Lachnospiraceae bacterium]|nr:hypothetical protein [Lachnospiraceae bacterium]
MKKKLVALILVGTMLVSSAFTVNAESVKPDKKTETTEGQKKKEEKTGKKDVIKDKVLKDLPTEWDLSELYADEEAFEADMERLEELIPEIKKLRGTMDSVEGILNYLESPDTIEIFTIEYRAGMYTNFLSSLDATDAWAQKASARFNEVIRKVAMEFSFFEPEIMEMPLKKRQEIFSDERLAPYAYELRNFTDPDYKYLSEEQQTAETLFGSVANQLKIRNIFDNVEREKPEFEYPDGRKGRLTDAVFSNIMDDSQYDHEFRKEIYLLRNDMRQPYANTYAALLEGQMKYNWAKAQNRGFDSTLDYKLKDSEVDPAVYDRIIEFAHRVSPKVYEYYDARKKILDLDEIMLCDLNVSVTDYEPKKVSYEEAVNTGRKAVSVWGDEYLETFDRIIEKPHVDVYPSDTKETGAFESLDGNEYDPFVLLNFDGSESYTSTIVHEMGHAVYSELTAENQNIYYTGPGIFTQEVASTSNEIMLHKYMIENAKTDEEKLYWLDREINLFLNSLSRQCLYSEFEDYCYKTIENGGSLNADDLAEKWQELERLYYGDGVTIPDNSGIDWARIPHMYYGYYVYKYATAITYAASVCNKVEEDGQKEIDAYLDFLKAGKSDYPANLLGIAGVDPMDDDTYDSAEKLISDLIDEFIETAK